MGGSDDTIEGKDNQAACYRDYRNITLAIFAILEHLWIECSDKNFFSLLRSTACILIWITVNYFLTGKNKFCFLMFKEISTWTQNGLSCWRKLKNLLLKMQPHIFSCCWEQQTQQEGIDWCTAEIGKNMQRIPAAFNIQINLTTFIM